MTGYTLAQRGRRWVAVIELDADECEATAYAFGPSDGVYAEMLMAADEIRTREDDGR